MPELPEVETIAVQLNRVLSGKNIQKIVVLNPKSFEGKKSDVVGQTIVGVARRAKTLTIGLENHLYLLIHLKMTGQLIYVDGASRVTGGHPSHDFHDKLPNQHTRIIFGISDGTVLFFNDLRKFGWIKVVTEKDYEEYFSRFGPDAVPSIDLNYLKVRAERMPKSSIKKFILDQGVISGVGNIYADEALFEARIAPTRPVSSLSNKEWKNLADAIVDKLEFAIEKGGTTDSDYVNALGEKGGMQNYLNVYHKTGTPCPNKCGGTITRIKVAGRGTHYCPICQEDL